MTHTTKNNSRSHQRNNETGWAMLGLILALTILGIMMAQIVPGVQFEMRREKELEMMYRGQQMAEGIVRYYNLGRLGPINLQTPPPYGHLIKLDQLKKEVRVGGLNPMRFVRTSAMIDPMVNDEWQPVRVRDERLAPAIAAYCTAYNIPIPPQWMLIAGPLKKKVTLPGESSSSSSFGTGSAAFRSTTSAGFPSRTSRSDDDDDEEDGDDGFLNSIPNLDKEKLPIVAVCSRRKGDSIHTLWGLNGYENWVFVCVATTTQAMQTTTTTPNTKYRSGTRTGN